MAEERHIFPFLWMRGEEEGILRNEIEKICECGIRAVCVEARPHDDFCGPGWWHDMDIVIDEAKKRDMQIWILDDKHFPTGYANGLIEKKYPERKKLYLAHSTADIYGGQHQRTLNVSRMLKPNIGYWQIGDPVDYEERANNKLYAILAVRLREGNVFSEDVVNLTDTFDGTYAKFTLPEGQWRVFVLYHTKTDGGNDTYINMIDSVSAATQIEGVYESHYEKYGSEFGKTIAGFFSDEPQLGNVTIFNDWDPQVGRMKMQLPWSGELEEALKEKYGDKLPEVLPFLFTETEEQDLRTKIRYDYMDQVSRLYKKNFSDRIGKWCEDHGVEYIGHVVEDNGLHSRLGLGAAHYFRAMSGQHMAGIDCIGGQVIYGASNLGRKGMTDTDGEFFHYTLGKMGASCSHLEPKKKGRLMCELFGAYGWNFGVRDMKYLLDHLLVKGVNYLVPHAFSMAEYPDTDCPPHFYARGNNPEFPYFVKLMKYADRMCRLLSGGQHVASVAVLYDAEADWLGGNMPMQKVIRQLLEHQIDLDIVSLDMLENLEAYNGKLVSGEEIGSEAKAGSGEEIGNEAKAGSGEEIGSKAKAGGKLMINGVTFGALIVGYTPKVPEKLIRFAARAQAAGLPVVFVDRLPEGTVEGADWLSAEAAGGKAEESAAGKAEGSIAGKAEEGAAGKAIGSTVVVGVDKVSLSRKIAEILAGCRAVPLAELAGYVKELGLEDIGTDTEFKDLSFYHYNKDRQIFVFQNESPSGTYRGNILLPTAGPVVYYDAMADRYEAAEYEPAEGGVKTALELEPGECVVIMEQSADSCITCVHESFRQQLTGLTPMDISEDWKVSMVKSIDYPNFSEGERMEKLVPISDEKPSFAGIIRYEKTVMLEKIPKKAVLRAEHVYEMMKITVNGQEAAVRIFPPYQVEIGRYLKKGENTIVIEAATTPARDMLAIPQPPFDFSYEAMEPTGMFGKVELFLG